MVINDLKQKLKNLNNISESNIHILKEREEMLESMLV